MQYLEQWKLTIRLGISQAIIVHFIDFQKKKTQALLLTAFNCESCLFYPSLHFILFN